MLFWRDQVLGVVLLALVGLVLFDRPLDVLGFVACMYCFAFITAEVGVWLGVVERKKK